MRSISADMPPSPPQVNATAHERALALLREFVEQVEYAMLTTRAADGALVARPLQTLDIDASGTLWHFTSARSAKVAAIRADARVNLAYADVARRRYLGVSGTAQCGVDRARIDALWRPAQTIFFPGGRDDPDLVLLGVAPHFVRYWDGNESVPGFLWKLGRAIALGEASDLGSSAGIDLDDGGG